jgi:hypothetical protein
MLFSLSIEAQQIQTLERTNSISLDPSQCVALNKGNTCYIDINVSWTAIEKGGYCLYSSQEKAPIQCWRDKISGVFTGEITLQDNVTFSLNTAQSDILLSSVELEMVWVYKKKQRSQSTWRMF